MRVLFLVEGTTVPASRYRASELFPRFEALGIRCELLAGYGDAYNRVSRTPFAHPYKLACRLKRALLGFRGVAHDVVFLQRTAIPHTAGPERMLARVQPRLVFDFDDALWMGPRGHSRLRARAFRLAVDAAAWVVPGNRYLAERANSADKTTIIPTVVDTDHYRPAPRAAGPRLVVGWMGTRGNFPFLRQVLPSVLAAVSAREDTMLRIVSNARLDELDSHPRVEQIAWSAESEVDLLQSFDVGLMPLADDERARGKCGFKMIQYMSVGCPVLASAVGANLEIFEGSDAGELLPARTMDWSKALTAILRSAERRQHMGARGRARAVERYSAEAGVRQYVRVFERVAAGV